MTPELLAPAKDADHGIMAVNAGADALYIGAGTFSARKNAGNTGAEISRLISYAHKYQARVYAALNTLLHDREIPEAVALLHQLHDAGIDGAIIQDLGLLDAGFPSVPLIASTQTHNNTVERVQFLQAVGFSRVILARELSVAEMGRIHQETDISLEAFVHGALCMSYSGQCYLSYARGGRSANRGACAQPCRKRFQLLDGTNTIQGDGHLLSMRDLNRIHLLGEMLDAGISSFKIEGRLKDAAYVINVVAAYRAALDAVLEERNTLTGKDVYTIDFTPDPSRVFHRGFVDGFASGTGRMATIESPKAMGTSIGCVTRCNDNRIALDTGTQLTAGDGLCFFDGDGTLTGAQVELVQQSTATLSDTKSIRPGTEIFRNRDHAFLDSIKKSRLERKVPIQLALSETDDTLHLTAADFVGNRVTVPLTGPFESAENQNGVRQRWEKQLRKTGSTEFLCETFTMDVDALPFVPVSQINALRRRGLEALTEARVSNRKRLPPGTLTSPVSRETLNFDANIANRYAHRVHTRLGATSIVDAPEAGTSLAGKPVMNSRYCLRRELNACLQRPEGASLKGPLHLLDPDTGEILHLSFDCAACEMHVVLPDR